MHARPGGSGEEALAARFLSAPMRGGHAVQFYDREPFLCATVGEFVSAGLRAGEQVVVICTAAHQVEFARRIAPELLSAATDAGDIAWLDAETTLASFMQNGMPDAALFEAMLARALGQLAPAAAGSSRPAVRAYGEMVDVLWKRRNGAAAMRLEELWSSAARSQGFSLLCAYAMEHFASAADTHRFVDVCRAHHHVLPSESFAGIVGHDARLREISALQQRARALEHELEHRKELERSLREVLAQRERVERELRDSVERERAARAEAEASAAFKQIFIGMLGHDLRNPLSTILTSTRIMARRRELPPESHKRIERVIASAERMQRMIEQIRDVTRARLPSGIPIRKGDALDLIPRVLKIVEEVRTTHPGRRIDFQPEFPCKLRVDGDRFEQVVSNLVANAVVHGDPTRTITVTLGTDDGVTRLSVHNYGPAIEPAFLPLLFDPFERGGCPLGHSDGLGLGLYISKCIIEAHGGTITVESSPERGTRFEVSLPQN